MPTAPYALIPALSLTLAAALAAAAGPDPSLPFIDPVTGQIGVRPRLTCSTARDVERMLDFSHRSTATSGAVEATRDTSPIAR